MSLEITQTSSSLLLKGNINLRTSPVLLKALQQPNAIFCINLAAVTALDNAGVATLIQALRLAEARNLAIQFTAVPDCVYNAWELSGVTDLFNKVID